MKKLPKGFWWSVFGALVVYFLMVLIGNAREFINSLAGFSWWLFGPILLLSLANYNLRFLKWDYIMRCSSVNIKKSENYRIFMAGLAGTISPGKSGELIKPFLLLDRFQLPLERTIPVFFFERLTDFMGLILLSFIGIFLGRRDITSALILSFFMIAILFFLTNPLFWRLVFGLTGWNPKRGPFRMVYEISNNIQNFWRADVVFYTLFLTVLAWGAECTGYYLVFKGFGGAESISIIWAIFIYSASTILGAITFVPGGLGITEGSLTGLAISVGKSKSIAISSTLIIRAATLWFAVLLGILFLFKLQQDRSSCAEPQKKWGNQSITPGGIK